MIYLTTGLGVLVLAFLVMLAVGLGRSAQRGDRLLREYHEAHGRYYQDDWDAGLEALWKWKEEPEGGDDE